MTSQTGKQTIAKTLLYNISRSKRKQTNKFGHLIGYNITNTFLEKSYAKLLPNPFLKSQNWTYLLIDGIKFYTVCFYCMSSWGLSKYIETADH